MLVDYLDHHVVEGIAYANIELSEGPWLQYGSHLWGSLRAVSSLGPLARMTTLFGLKLLRYFFFGVRNGYERFLLSCEKKIA